MKNKKAFKENMAILSEIHDKKLSDLLIKTYWIFFKNYDDNLALQVFSQAIASCKFFPKPADFLEITKQIAPAVSPREKANMEAEKIIQHLQRFGRTVEPEYSDKITAMVMTGRWEYKDWCRNIPTTELKWWKKEFVDCYISYHSLNKASNNRLINHSQLKQIEMDGLCDL